MHVPSLVVSWPCTPSCEAYLRDSEYPLHRGAFVKASCLPERERYEPYRNAVEHQLDPGELRSRQKLKRKELRSAWGRGRGGWTQRVCAARIRTRQEGSRCMGYAACRDACVCAGRPRVSSQLEADTVITSRWYVVSSCSRCINSSVLNNTITSKAVLCTQNGNFKV